MKHPFYEKIIKNVYKVKAENLGDSSSCTMPDEIVREREEEIISNVVLFLGEKKELRILDLGCGNGYTINVLANKYPQHQYWGIDYTGEMVKICQKRGLKNCTFRKGDARNLNFPRQHFDFVFTERCLINILDSNDQEKALQEIHRVLKPDSHYLLIECFTDGLDENNKARDEFDLEPLTPVSHNLYFEKQRFSDFIANKFTVFHNDFQLGNFCLHQNFLSSHYFISRVLHPFLVKQSTVRNSEFVKFFSFLPPIGNYSQIQALLLKKKI